jgi:hypothetical protein
MPKTYNNPQLFAESTRNMLVCSKISALFLVFFVLMTLDETFGCGSCNDPCKAKTRWDGLRSRDKCYLKHCKQTYVAFMKSLYLPYKIPILG